MMNTSEITWNSRWAKLQIILSLSASRLCKRLSSLVFHTHRQVFSVKSRGIHNGENCRSSFSLIPASRLPLCLSSPSSLISANAVRLPQLPRLPHIQASLLPYLPHTHKRSSSPSQSNPCTESTLLPQIHVDDEREAPITKLISKTGLGWSSELGTIAATNEWWKAKIQECKGARNFRHAGIEPALKLKFDKMYSNIVATGEYA